MKELQERILERVDLLVPEIANAIIEHERSLEDLEKSSGDRSQRTRKKSRKGRQTILSEEMAPAKSHFEGGPPQLHALLPPESEASSAVPLSGGMVLLITMIITLSHLN